MPYLIDGHNLIPKISGLNLAEMADEEKLIAILQSFCRARRQKVEVFFDNAAPGFKRTHRFGSVTAHFIQKGIPADDAIIDRLHRLRKDARNWTVVSSDRRIQSEARACQAAVVLSEDFERQIREAVNSDPEINQSEVKISPAEVDEWIKLFSSRK